MRPLASTSNLSYNILPEWTANCTAVELFIMSRLSVCLSVYPFVCLSLGTLAACTLATTGHQRLRTANLSADGRRSTAIFGLNCHRQGDISSGVLGGIRGYTPYTNLRVFFDSVYSPQ